VDDFRTSVTFRDSLELYLFLRHREGELAGASQRLYASLRAYLYDHLSIEEMESPETLLKKL
jgi:hypothetical protein